MYLVLNVVALDQAGDVRHEDARDTLAPIWPSSPLVLEFGHSRSS